MKNILITLILLSSGLIIAQTPISTSTQSTATERNNARLIVEDNNGNLHVTYYDNGVYYSSSNDNGISWSTAVLVDETGRNPSLAIDNNNILHIAYKLGGINAYDIVHRTYNEGTWSEFDYIYHDEAYIAPVSRPVIAIDSENNLHCVFQRAGYTAVPNSEIWYNNYTPETGWGTDYVNISNSYGASEYPTLTIDNNNNIYAFWKDSGEDIANDKMVLLRKYTVNTGWDVDYTNISNTTGNGSYATMDPSVVTDINGNIHLVWKDSEPGNREILYKKCTSGVWDTEYINISNTTEASAHPSISTDYWGNLHVFWAEKIGNIYYEVVYKKYDTELETWSDMTNISNTVSVESEYPNTPIKSNNTTSVIWTEGDDSPFSVMYYGELLPVNINKNINNLSINVYPNPTTGIFNLKASVRPLSVEIININGQIIRQYSINNDFKVNISDQPKGIYIIKIITENIIHFQKVIIM